MIEKGDAIKYSIIGLILAGLIGLLILFQGGPTGYAVFGDDEQAEFDLGNYSNVEYNGSDVVLSEDNLTGTYTSQIFDAGNDAVWNNISWVGSKPNLEILFAVDGVADVWKSSDGASWSLIKDDYTGADGNGATYMIKNSSNSLFILFNQDLWKSDDSGVTWGKVNDDINPGASNNGKVMSIDSDDYIYIVDGADKVLKSTDSGVSFSSVNDSFGEGPNAGGMIVDDNDDIFIIDNSANVWKSDDSGVTWTKENDDYNGGVGNDISDVFVNSSGNLFALHNQDLWYSADAGVNWVLVNDDYNEGDTGNGQVIYIDSNDNIYIVDGSEDVYYSTDSGVNFVKLVENINGGNGNIFGLTSIIESSSLDFQVRSCDDNACSGESWSDITDTLPQDLSVDNNRYFQYKVDFTSPALSMSSSLQSVNIYYDLVNTAPIINLVEPQDGNAYGYNESLDLNFSVSDADNNIDSCWYNIDDGEDISLVSCGNISFDIAEGSHDLNIYVNDSLGLRADDSVSFSVAVGAPTIVLYYPIDVYFSSGDNIVFNYTPTDVDLDSCELWGDFNRSFVLNQTDANPTSGSVNQFSLNLDDGVYMWNIRCVDDLGNSAFNGNKSFYVDSVNPSLSLSEPIGSKTSRTVSASWTVNDLSPISCVYNVYQGASLEISNTSVDCTDNSASFEVSSDASFIFNFYVNDSAGNLNSANSRFSVDTSTSVSSLTTGGSSGGGGSGSGFVLTNKTVKLNLQISDIENIIAYEGDKKTLSLNVKNTGSRFFNKCRLLGKGEIESWIYSTQIEGIAPGQNIDFIFDLSVPEEIESGDYSGKLEIKCDEGSDFKDIIVSVPGLDIININQIIQEKNLVKISYNFDNSYVIGDVASVDIWIEDSDGYEIERIQDIFDINKEGLIERNVEIKFDGSGVYYVYFALSDDLESFVRESVVLGEATKTTGSIVLDTLKRKMSVYIGFLILICVGIFSIWKRHGKLENSNHYKHHWLLRKKK